VRTQIAIFYYVLPFFDNVLIFSFSKKKKKTVFVKNQEKNNGTLFKEEIIFKKDIKVFFE